MQILQDNIKWVAAFMLMSIWASLVFAGLTPVSDFVQAIKDMIFAIVGLHAVTNYKRTGT